MDCVIKQLKVEPTANIYLKLLGSLTTNEMITLRQNEVYTGGFIVEPTDLCEETTLGSILILWKRLEFLADASKPYNELRIPLSSVVVEEKPFEIELSIKDLIDFGESLQMNLSLRNKSGTQQRFLLSLVETEGFLISGDAKKSFEIRNQETKSFLFNIVPMSIGRKKLPGVQLQCQSMDNKLIWDSSGTRFVTVLPRKIN